MHTSSIKQVTQQKVTFPVWEIGGEIQIEIHTYFSRSEKEPTTKYTYVKGVRTELSGRCQSLPECPPHFILHMFLKKKEKEKKMSDNLQANEYQ